MFELYSIYFKTLIDATYERSLHASEDIYDNIQAGYWSLFHQQFLDDLYKPLTISDLIQCPLE